MSQTSVRLLRLLRLLQTPDDWTSPQLAEKLGVTTRTIRKDIERLRGLGYIHAIPGTAGGYRVDPRASVPVPGSMPIPGSAPALDAAVLTTIATAPLGVQEAGQLGMAGTGFSVAEVGDVNGDGFDDLIVGAPNARTDPYSFYASGVSYVVFGHGGTFDGSLDLAIAAGELDLWSDRYRRAMAWVRFGTNALAIDLGEADVGSVVGLGSASDHDGRAADGVHRNRGAAPLH